MLTRAGCQTRQLRFRDFLAQQRLDSAVITSPPEIYYLTGQLFRSHPAFLYVERDGECWLAASTDEGDALVDDRVTYEPHTLFTLNPDPMRRLARVVSDRLGGAGRPRRIGWQAESLPRLLGDVVAAAIHPDEWVLIDDGIAAMEKRKDPDEVELLRTAIGCTLAAYDSDRAAIAPGVNELEVLEAGHKAATLFAGETVHHGGDYRCGEFGGSARDRQIEAGELYIIDGQSTYRGYAADLCRTFAVTEPTPLQQEIFDLLASILAEVPHRIRPGGHGTELWQWIDGRIREHPHLRETGLIHHGGHGVGLRPHEAPDVNRDRDGIFEVGDVVSCEPGAYSPDLNAGIRLENTFLVTDDGCEVLSDYPVSLT